MGGRGKICSAYSYTDNKYLKRKEGSPLLQFAPLYLSKQVQKKIKRPSKIVFFINKHLEHWKHMRVCVERNVCMVIFCRTLTF